MRQEIHQNKLFEYPTVYIEYSTPNINTRYGIEVYITDILHFM